MRFEFSPGAFESDATAPLSGEFVYVVRAGKDVERLRYENVCLADSNLVPFKDAILFYPLIVHALMLVFGEERFEQLNSGAPVFSIRGVAKVRDEVRISCFCLRYMYGSAHYFYCYFEMDLYLDLKREWEAVSTSDNITLPHDPSDYYSIGKRSILATCRLQKVREKFFAEAAMVERDEKGELLVDIADSQKRLQKTIEATVQAQIPRFREQFFADDQQVIKSSTPFPIFPGISYRPQYSMLRDALLGALSSFDELATAAGRHWQALQTDFREHYGELIRYYSTVVKGGCSNVVCEPFYEDPEIFYFVKLREALRLAMSLRATPTNNIWSDIQDRVIKKLPEYIPILKYDAGQRVYKISDQRFSPVYSAICEALIRLTQYCIKREFAPKCVDGYYASWFEGGVRLSVDELRNNTAPKNSEREQQAMFLFKLLDAYILYGLPFDVLREKLNGLKGDLEEFLRNYRPTLGNMARNKGRIAKKSDLLDDVIQPCFDALTVVSNDALTGLLSVAERRTMVEKVTELSQKQKQAFNKMDDFYGKFCEISNSIICCINALGTQLSPQDGHDYANIYGAVLLILGCVSRLHGLLKGKKCDASREPDEGVISLCAQYESQLIVDLNRQLAVNVKNALCDLSEACWGIQHEGIGVLLQYDVVGGIEDVLLAIVKESTLLGREQKQRLDAFIALSEECFPLMVGRRDIIYFMRDAIVAKQTVVCKGKNSKNDVPWNILALCENYIMGRINYVKFFCGLVLLQKDVKGNLLKVFNSWLPKFQEINLQRVRLVLSGERLFLGSQYALVPREYNELADFYGSAENFFTEIDKFLQNFLSGGVGRGEPFAFYRKICPDFIFDGRGNNSAACRRVNSLQEGYNYFLAMWNGNEVPDFVHDARFDSRKLELFLNLALATLKVFSDEEVVSGINVDVVEGFHGWLSKFSPENAKTFYRAIDDILLNYFSTYVVVDKENYHSDWQECRRLVACLFDSKLFKLRAKEFFSLNPAFKPRLEALRDSYVQLLDRSLYSRELGDEIACIVASNHIFISVPNSFAHMTFLALAPKYIKEHFLRWLEDITTLKVNEVNKDLFSRLHDMCNQPLIELFGKVVGSRFGKPFFEVRQDDGQFLQKVRKSLLEICKKHIRYLLVNKCYADVEKFLKSGYMLDLFGGKHMSQTQISELTQTELGLNGANAMQNYADLRATNDEDLIGLLSFMFPALEGQRDGTRANERPLVVHRGPRPNRVFCDESGDDEQETMRL